MKWEEYDKEILTPYEKTGSKAKEFNPETTVFSYMAVRHACHHAFQAANQPHNKPVEQTGDKPPPCYICGGIETHEKYCSRSR